MFRLLKKIREKVSVFILLPLDDALPLSLALVVRSVPRRLLSNSCGLHRNDWHHIQPATHPCGFRAAVTVLA